MLVVCISASHQSVMRHPPLVAIFSSSLAFRQTLLQRACPQIGREISASRVEVKDGCVCATKSTLTTNPAANSLQQTQVHGVGLSPPPESPSFSIAIWCVNQIKVLNLDRKDLSAFARSMDPAGTETIFTAMGPLVFPSLAISTGSIVPGPTLTVEFC